MKLILTVMKSFCAIYIVYILYHSVETFAQESSQTEGESIYVPSLNTTAKVAPGSSYEDVITETGEVREARKVGLLRGIWKKPKVSPLYLVNGTICRFVNSAPICTTLATTGLGLNGGINGANPNNFNPFGANNFGSNNQQFPLNNNNNNNNQNINNQQFANRNNNNNNQLYTPGNFQQNNNQFNRQQQPPFVSSALSEEESEEVAVQADSNESTDNQSTDGQQQQQQKGTTAKPVQTQQSTSTNKPVTVIRRPILPLRLPLRQFSIG